MATYSDYFTTTEDPGGWDDWTGTMTHGHGVITEGTPAKPTGPPLFSIPDYVVFAISLAIPLVVGVFFFLISLRKPSTEEFLMGERNLNFVVVALSIVASLLNGVFVIGVPAEIHYYGIRAAYQYFGLVISVLVVSHVFVAKYQTMSFTSAYQYVERRYNKPTRIVASLIFCASVTIFLAVVLYVPALAFKQVTNLSIYATVVITGVICTLYTTIGGLKAVVWTDAIQMLILLGGLVAIAVIGAARMGGGNHVWEIAEQDGRINFRNFSFDPRERTSFWSQTLGAAVVFIGLFISNQMMVQRYMAVPTPAKATASMYLTMTLALPLYILIAIIGLVMHAFYSKCDPLARKAIDSGDKIVPLFLMELLGRYKGIPGLIMSSVFAAALSSVSAVINSLSAVCLEDFIDPAYASFTKGKKLADRKRRWIAVLITVTFGIITIGLSFAADRFTSKLIQATGVIWGVLGGPLAGIFVMGFLMPFVNAWGAISGMISGLVIALWLAIGAVIHAPSPQALPIGISCAPNATIRVAMSVPTSPPHTNLIDWYNISYMWYGVIGTGVCIVVGMIVSIATYGFSYDYMSSRDPAVMFSVADECCCCCPLSCKKCYRCGVKFGEEDTIKLKRIDRVQANGQKVTHQELDVYDGSKQNKGFTGADGSPYDLSDQTYLEGKQTNGHDTQHYSNGRQNSAYAVDDNYIERGLV